MADARYDCRFRVSLTATCGEHTGGSEVKYCRKHRRTKCRCGVPATHYCFYSNDCKEPLCDNPYCEAHHNIEDHIKKEKGRVRGWPRL